MSGGLDHGPEEVERNGAGAALGEHAAEASFAGADIEDDPIANVAALLQHYESRSKVRLGSPSSTKRMYSEAKAVHPLGSSSAGIRIWSVKKGRPLCTSDVSWRPSAQRDTLAGDLDLQAGDFSV